VMQHLAKLPYALWENQFNLLGSHDISRLHNNPAVHPEEYRGAVIFQFLLTGAPSVYYGDEAETEGVLGTIDGCRYPMPWGKDFRNTDTWKFYRTLIHTRLAHPALRRGGMKFLYAEGQVVALARFSEKEVFVGILSTDPEDVTIRLPLGAVGAKKPVGMRDLFGRVLEYEILDENSIALKIKAHQAYLFECERK